MVKRSRLRKVTMKKKLDYKKGYIKGLKGGIIDFNPIVLFKNKAWVDGYAHGLAQRRKTSK